MEVLHVLLTMKLLGTTLFIVNQTIQLRKNLS